MAYSAPSTWVAGAVLTAAQLNQQLRDNLLAAFPLGVDAWTAYTPTLTQSGAVTKTVTVGKYQRIGRLVYCQFSLAVTGPGTASNIVLVGLPVAAAAGSVPGGVFWINDASAGINYVGAASVSAGAVGGLVNGVAGFMGQATGSFSAALASGDAVLGCYMYEAAS